MRTVIVACLLLCASNLNAQTLTVVWDAPPVPVAGYVVYVGTASGVYDTVASAGSALSWTHPGPIVPGQRYYAAVASVDAAGTIGPKSVEVSGVAPSTPAQTSPNGASTTIGGLYVTDANGRRWSLRVDRATLRDDIHAGGGFADLVLWWNGNIYAQVDAAHNGPSWFLFTAEAWQYIGAVDPRVPTPTPPPAPDTEAPSITMMVGRRTGNNYPVTITNVVDNVGIDHVEVLVDGVVQVRLVLPTSGTINTANAVWSTKVLIKTTGGHLVTARAYDTTYRAGVPTSGNPALSSVTIRR